ncbi:hypothetical protein B9Z55_011844 [Caenorhabditis nigoni]|nr:hypothetical protein B9Z55_011844 [Caenorhabditis nigoni]
MEEELEKANKELKELKYKLPKPSYHWTPSRNPATNIEFDKKEDDSLSTCITLGADETPKIVEKSLVMETKNTSKNLTPAAATKMTPRKVPEISPLEYKYKNNGPIKFHTQDTRDFHLVPDQKAFKEVKIEKVKWDEGPIEFYETGLDVDEVELNTPSSKGVPSSTILTASIREFHPKNYALFLSILIILIFTGTAAQTTNSTVFSVRYSKIQNRNFYIEIIMMLFFLHFFPVLLTVFLAAIIHHYKMEPMKNELETKRKEIKEANEKINEAMNGKPLVKNGIKDSLEEEFDCIEGPIGMGNEHKLTPNVETTTAGKITPKNSTPTAATKKNPGKVPPLEYKYKNNGPIKFQTQNTRDLHLEPNQKVPKEVKIEKVKWDEGPIEFYETGLGVDKAEIYTSEVPGSTKALSIFYN